MAIKLKPIQDQVLFITGASSGIGLTTAREAAKKGAKIVLVARSEEGLADAVNQIEASGGEAIYAVADVSKPEELRRAADAAVARFGRIDTWINNAGLGQFGRLTETNIDDDKRLFEINFWGVVNGSRLAVEYLANGGAIINIGSEVSQVPVPIQGMYSASKHAVLGFTDALRMELMDAGLPISVTLIKPAAINTHFPQHAANRLPAGQSPMLPAPVYAPELVSDQILYAATTPVRDLFAGGGGWLMATMHKVIPGVMDFITRKTMIDQQVTDKPLGPQREGLYAPTGEGFGRGNVDRDRMIRTHSVYNAASRHPYLAMAVAAAGVAAAAAAMGAFSLPEPTTTERARKYANRAVRGARTYFKV
ncbi:MAG TPA: SDR family oxidoreductase [Tepidisphaeraceae bacterium]|jgi:short-subunit dehydrogenase